LSKGFLCFNSRRFRHAEAGSINEPSGQGLFRISLQPFAAIEHFAVQTIEEGGGF
jgi:hypothetical protein